MMEDGVDISDQSTTDLISDIAKAFAALASLFVFASLLHEWMYFWTIGREFLQIYTIADFAKLSIIWLPVSLILGSLGFIVNFVDLNARVRAVQTFGNSGLEAWRTPDRMMRYLVIGIFIIVFLGVPQLTWATVSVLQLPVFIIVSYLIGKMVANGRLSLPRRPVDGIMLYAFIGWLLVSALFGGLSEGLRDVKRNAPIYQLVLKEKSFDAIILRTIDRGVLYKKIDQKNVIFVNWTELQEIHSETIAVPEVTVVDLIRSWIYGQKDK